MKFSSSLKFNAVSEWWEDYIAYDALKKYIYQLEKHQHGQHQITPYYDIESNERASLMGRAGNSTDDVFAPYLDRELNKIVLFYEQQEKDLLDEVLELEESVERQEAAGLAAEDRYVDDEFDDDDEDDDESISRSPDATRRRRRKSSSVGRPRTISISGGTAVGIPDDPPRRRYSISSASDHNPELEESGASLRGPKGTIGRLANKFNIMRDSITSSTLEATIWNAKSDFAYDTRLLYKRKITTLYTSVSNLRSYVEVNYSGFRKILKKYDKVTYSELKDRYLHETVELKPPFTQASRSQLADAIARLIALYAKCVTRGDATMAKQQLRLHQRENIAWERDTVWRQMIGRERRGEVDGEPKAIGGTLIKPEEEEVKKLRFLGIRVTKKKIFMIFAAIVLAVLLNVQTVAGEEANRCFAILTFCTVLWATEAIPLFVTSMFVPLLLVGLQVIRGEGGKRLERREATSYVFSVMFSPTIMLLIGGFTISSALSKTNIDRVLITRVLSLAGSKPRSVLLAFMGVSCFASMWISNVAAPTLCFTLIRPILRTLPPKSAFGPCLILAIALAANIGGQSSPISSPQNLIALQEMDPPLDWGKWFAVSLPVSAISILLIWALLLASYKPARSPDGEGEIEIKTIRPTREAFTLKQYWVTFVCLVTIGLWCVEHKIEKYVGDMGVIAIIPIVAFFSTGVLKKDDFEQFMWTIVFLAMGGIALGKGVVSSGLLEVMDENIRGLVDGFSVYNVVLILAPIVLVISTFISHTIASVLLVPIAKEVGSNLGGHGNLLIFITALICSTGMAPLIPPPDVLMHHLTRHPRGYSATQEDEMGELYLSNVDFLKNGVPASIIATMVVTTVGFLLMKAIGL